MLLFTSESMVCVVRSLITLIKSKILIRYFPRYEYEFVANGSFHLQKKPSLFHFSFLSFSHYDVLQIWIHLNLTMKVQIILSKYQKVCNKYIHF